MCTQRVASGAESPEEEETAEEHGRTGCWPSGARTRQWGYGVCSSGVAASCLCYLEKVELRSLETT